MISGRTLLLALFFLAVPLYGEGVTFIQRAQAPAPIPGKKAADTESQNALIAQLKQQAVVEWMQNHLKERYASYEKLITKEFAERYILDYRMGRNAQDKSIVELTGHLDADGLRRWLRVAESKKAGGATSLSPIFILTSSVPGLVLTASETGIRTKDSPLVQSSLAQATVSFQKLNVKFALPELNRSLPQTPAKQENEILRLKDIFSGSPFNAVLWLDWVPCKGCGGVRLDSYLYSLSQGKLLLSRSDDLALANNDLNNSTKVKATLKTPLQTLANDYEELLSSGSLNSVNFSVNFEGVDSYRTYKLLEQLLGQLDFVVQSIPSKLEARSATFEIASQLSAEELGQRLGSEGVAGYKFRTLRADGRNVTIQLTR